MLHGGEDAANQHGNGAVEIVHRRLLDGADHAHNASIRECAIEAAPGAHRCVHRSGNVGFVGYVALHKPSSIAERGGHCLSAFGAVVGDDHVSAFGHEKPRRCFAKAAGGAGDYCNFAGISSRLGCVHRAPLMCL